MKTEKTGQLQGRDENNRFLPGHSGNLNGRPLGSENFKTKLYKAIEKLAKDSKVEISVEDLEISIIEVGLKKAKEGDYKFWSDIFDRIYGKPESTSVTINNSISDTNITAKITDDEFKDIIKRYEDKDNK
tara:strand:- start:2325 stop:2714 length:390 start_codon:yes stop_codon:yes gene_type:complete